MKNQKELDEFFMRRCLDLARGGIGLVEPNPYVGCVLVQEGKIVGEGFHHRYGGPHAEVVAIQSVQDKVNFKDVTLYVNLEPCSHHGKTPPCADLIIQKGIGRVVVAIEDPNPLVQGNGVRKLWEAGIKVTQGVCQEEALELNKAFITFHTLKRPYIILKWAQTRDGFIDISSINRQRENFWISSPLTDVLTHSWRAATQAILIGANTLKKDDPQLNVRHYVGKNPLRIVLTSTLLDEDIIKKYKFFSIKSPILIVNPYLDRKIHHIEWVKLSFDRRLLQNLCSELYHRNVQSLIVEGGKTLLESFIHENLWDEARVIVGNKIFRHGLPAPVLEDAVLHQITHPGEDLLMYYKPRLK